MEQNQRSVGFHILAELGFHIDRAILRYAWQFLGLQKHFLSAFIFTRTLPLCMTVQIPPLEKSRYPCVGARILLYTDLI
ncbi:hypothetical protein STEG23_027430 [Scotinomys teguina]